MDAGEAIEALRQTPATLRSLLGELSEPWLRAGDARADWGPYDILGHLIHGERTDWIPRARVIVEHGTARPFERSDREAQFAAAEQSLMYRLDEFAMLRTDNLAALTDLPLDQLDTRGLHPDLGEVTLGQLVATWAAHDLSHIAQTAEVMARRYRDEVGPWRAYLPVLDRDPLVG